MRRELSPAQQHLLGPNPEPWKTQAIDACDWFNFGATGARPPGEDGDASVVAWRQRVDSQLALTGQQQKFLYTLWAIYCNEYRDAERDTWGESLHALQRAGAPHAPLAAARKPDDTQAVKAAVHWWLHQRAGRPCLLLVGKTGAGKSVAAAHAALKFAAQSKWWRNSATGSNMAPVSWLYCRTLVTADFEIQRAEFAAAERATFLVLDDLPDSAPPQATQSISNMIALRVDARRLTVITSNATAETLRKFLGDATSDRLTAAATAVRLAGGSLRTQERAR